MLVAGTYRNQSDCEEACQRLRAAQLSQRSVSICLLSDGVIHDKAEVGTKALKFGKAGAVLGGVVGGIIGLFAGAVGLAIPRFGATLGMGPLLSCFAGALLIGFVCAALGGLIGFGFPEYEVRTYETGLINGGVLLSVTGRDEGELRGAEAILKATGAVRVLLMSSDVPPRQSGPSGSQVPEG